VARWEGRGRHLLRRRALRVSRRGLAISFEALASSFQALSTSFQALGTSFPELGASPRGFPVSLETVGLLPRTAATSFQGPGISHAGLSSSFQGPGISHADLSSSFRLVADLPRDVAILPRRLASCPRRVGGGSRLARVPLWAKWDKRGRAGEKSYVRRCFFGWVQTMGMIRVSLHPRRGRGSGELGQVGQVTKACVKRSSRLLLQETHPPMQTTHRIRAVLTLQKD